MALQNNAPAPLSDPIARPRRAQFKGENRDPQEGLISDAWTDYFTAQSNVIEKMPARVAQVELSDQSGSIGATDITDGTFTSGLYRLTYYGKVTTVEPLTTVQFTVDWVDGGVTRTFTGAALDGSFTTSYETNTRLIRIDANSAVRYTVAVVSTGTLRFAFDAVLEEVKA